MIFSQVKYHLLCFVLILGELVPLLGEVMFGLEELIVPHEYSLCFAFFPRDLVLAPGENSFGSGDLACNLGELVLPHEKCCPLSLFLTFDVESPLLVQNLTFQFRKFLSALV